MVITSSLMVSGTYHWTAGRRPAATERKMPGETWNGGSGREPSNAGIAEPREAVTCQKAFTESAVPEAATRRAPLGRPFRLGNAASSMALT